MSTCGRQKNGPEGIHILAPPHPGLCHLTCQKFADVTIRNIERELERQKRERCHVEGLNPPLLVWKKEAESHGSKEVWPPEAGKNRESPERNAVSAAADP